MAKPQYRYKETMSLSRLLSGESNDHRRFSFFQEYARSREAAAVIGPLLKAWRIAIDFSDPKHCRLQGKKLILTVRDAGQENRLRQLTTRMKKALDQKGIEVDVIDIHLVPVPFALPKLPPAPLVERRETLEGAFSVARCADRVDDPALKATLKRLEDVSFIKCDLEACGVDQFKGKASEPHHVVHGGRLVAVADGLVRSYKGASGGYELARCPGEITLREVIESVEGPYRISRCQGDEYCCDHTNCRFHRIYEEVSQLVRDKLDEYTFAAICQQDGGAVCDHNCPDCGKQHT